MIENFKELSANEFDKVLKEDRCVLIDIRTIDEIRSGRNSGKIRGDALEIDFYSDNFLDKIKKLDKHKKYLIYCAHGIRSKAAKIKMKSLGFKNVCDLKKGRDEWKKEIDKDKK